MMKSAFNIKKTTMILTASLILKSTASFAEGPLSSDLYQSCSSTDMDFRVICASYILGFVDGLNSGAITIMYDNGEKDIKKLEETALKSIGLCIPANTSADTYANVFKKQYEANSEIKTLKANEGVYIALIEEFFCGNKR